MKIKTSIYFLAFFVFFFYSCTNSTIFKEYHKFEKQSWNRFEFLNFEMAVEESEQEYDIYLSVRHLPEFPYRKMDINFTMFLPSGEMRTADHELIFSDREGKGLSECLGDYCDISFPLRTGFVFTETGTVKFEIENKMTKLDTRGILEVGLIIKESD